MIQFLKEKVIKFEGFDAREVYWISVDTVTFVTEEFCLDPSSEWFDWKSHGSGLKYEFALALRRAEIVLVRGPAKPGTEQDSVIFRGGGKNDKNLDKTALYPLLPPGKKAIGDSGYKGMPQKVTITRGKHSPEMKKFLARAKSRQESLHSKLKFSTVCITNSVTGKTPKKKWSCTRCALKRSR